MGLENCQIFFDNPNGIFFPGQTLSGQVKFNFSSVKKVRGISISFKGEASVHWTESESHRDHNGKSTTRHISYNGSEQYFSMKYYVVGGANTDSIELQQGNHVFPFTTSIPNFLPSSFEGDKGYIRYTVKATLDRPWKIDQHIKAAFTVINHLDCNTNPQVREPATLTMEKFLCCCCCRQGPITGILKLPCTGYVSGQVVPYTLEIDNASKTKIVSIKLKIKKLVAYHAHSPRSKTRTTTDTVAEWVIGSGVPARDSDTISSTFTLPPLPPSNLQNCRIIDLEYALKIIVTIDGFHKDMVGQIPIMVGTIPLTNMVPLAAPAPRVGLEQPSFVAGSESSSARQPLLGWIPGPSGSTGPATATASAPAEPYLLPPPTYEECQFGTKSILDESDSEFTRLNNDRCYAPSYPVYNFNAPPAEGSRAPSYPVEGTSVAPPYPVEGASVAPPYPVEGASVAPPYPVHSQSGSSMMPGLVPIPPISNAMPKEGSPMPVPVHGAFAPNSMPSAPPPQKM